MSRPAQLEQQIARVQELQAEMLEGENLDGSNVITLEPSTPEVQTPPDSTETVIVESPATISKDEYNKLEQRYRTLQGMHQAEGSRSRNEVAALTAALQDVEDRLIAAERAAHTSPAPVKYITEKDEEEYGDTLDMVRRAAREEAEAISTSREGALMDRIAQLENQTGHFRNTVVPTVENLSKAQEEQVKAEFWGTISTNVPDWRAINDNAEFKAWLLAADPVTGGNRQQFLDQARQQYDAPRVIRFFEEWKRRTAGGQTPAPNKNTQAELERLVAPGTSKGGTTTQPEKKQWTGAEVGKFFRDVNSGKYADKPEERKRVEADIYAAQAEGRFR